MLFGYKKAATNVTAKKGKDEMTTFYIEPSSFAVRMAANTSSGVTSNGML